MLLALLNGCFPIPYAAPPLDLTVGVDPRPAGERGGRWPEAVDLRAGVVPLAFIAELRDRTIDPSVGFHAVLDDPSGSADWRLGGYGRVAMRTLRNDAPNRFTAVEPRVTVGVDVDERGRTGGEFLIGVAGRLGGWREGDAGASFSSNVGFIGVSYGEWGVALALDLGAQYAGDELAGRVVIGLEFRPPAAAGVLLVPIF
jgi:hypothetical protein